MNTNRTEPSKMDELLQRAEKFVALSREDFQKVPTADVQRFIRDLILEAREMESWVGHLQQTQAEFEESHRQATELFDLAPVWYFILDSHGVISKVNFTASHMFGASIEKMVNAPFINMVEPRHYDALRSYLKEIADTGRLLSIELEMHKSDGIVFYAQLQTVPLYQKSNLVYRVSVADITERKKTEEALRASEKRYRSFIEVTGVLGWTTNADGEVVEDIPSFRQFTGQTYEDVRGWGWSKALHPDDLERTVQVWKTAVSTKSSYEIEYRLRKYDGVYRYFLARGVPLLRDDGSILEWVGTCIDITERKQAEEELKKLRQALRASEQNFRSSFNESPLGIRIVNAKGENLYVNQALLNIFGLGSIDEFEEVPILDRYTPDSRVLMLERWEQRRLGEAGPAPYEASIVRKDGAVRTVEVFQKRVLWNGQKQFQLLYNDVTERKQAEEKVRELEVLKESDRVRSDFLANISHELRTLLAAIKGFTSTLLRDDVRWKKAERTNFLQTIDRETDRLTRLINDLLDMRRFEARSMTLNRAEYNVKDIFNSVHGQLSSLASRHHLEYITGEDLPRLYVDEMRIGQVISNLVDNAVKHSPPGSVITVSAHAGEGEVIISVIDRGEGIPPEYLEKIFDRFVQVGSIVMGRKGDTGMGLSICRGIVESHGGKIWVDSKLGEGSKFSFSLSVRKRAEDA